MTDSIEGSCTNRRPSTEREGRLTGTAFTQGCAIVASGRSRAKSPRTMVSRSHRSFLSSASESGQANATTVICAATSRRRETAASASSVPPRRFCLMQSSVATTSRTDQFMISDCMGESPTSIRHRAIADCTTAIRSSIPPGELTAAIRTASTAKITSASAALSLVREASPRCSASCSDASLCWCTVERFKTVTATRAATNAEMTAAGIAPREPAHIEIQTSRSNPINMQASLQEPGWEPIFNHVSPGSHRFLGVRPRTTAEAG